MEFPKVVSTTVEVVERIDVDPFVVTPIGGWQGPDAGSRWEVRYIERLFSGERRGGVVTLGPDPEYRAYGVKLKRDGTPLTGRPHLLPWFHSDHDLLQGAITPAVR